MKPHVCFRIIIKYNDFFQIDQVSVNRSRTSDNKNSTTNKTDSETADTASIVSSPGRPQPVNFDFHRQDTLRRDPTIIQPVAIRRSPDSPVVQSSDLDEEDDQHQVCLRKSATDQYIFL